MTEESIFAEALAIKDVAERAAYLERACGGDASLRAAVEALLAAHGVESPLDRPPVSLAKTGPYVPASVMIGDRIGPYTLREQIGEGGFGLVFVAEQTEPVRRKVALKILKAGMDTRDVIARFEAERQALALMDHPNISKVLDAGTTTHGRPYFVMELVRGMPMTEYCDRQKLPPRERLQLFVQVCLAVQHAHQKGVIHRDLKPSNVLVAPHDGKPVVKVIDFGIAKAIGQPLTDKTIYTRFAQMIGTPLYMSPEQAEVNQLDVDTRSDIYSLGVLLYELLTGTTPFDRERFHRAAFEEIRRIIREEEPPRPSTRLSSLGETLTAVSGNRGTAPNALATLLRGELDWVVMKCLEKDRERRYDSAAGLAKEVQRYLDGDAVEACPPTLGYRLRKFYRRNRAAVLGGAAFALVLAVAASVSATFGVLASRAASEARDNAQKAHEAEQTALGEQAKTQEANQQLERVADLQRRTRYAAEMNLIQSTYRNRDIPEALRILAEQRPKPGETDLRGPEWHYWNRKLNGYQNETVIRLPRPLLHLPGRKTDLRYALSPDGQLFAVADNERLRVYRTDSWQLCYDISIQEPRKAEPKDDVPAKKRPLISPNLTAPDLQFSDSGKYLLCQWISTHPNIWYEPFEDQTRLFDLTTGKFDTERLKEFGPRISIVRLGDPRDWFFVRSNPPPILADPTAYPDTPGQIIALDQPNETITLPSGKVRFIDLHLTKDRTHLLGIMADLNGKGPPPAGAKGSLPAGLGTEYSLVYWKLGADQPVWRKPINLHGKSILHGLLRDESSFLLETSIGFSHDMSEERLTNFGRKITERLVRFDRCNLRDGSILTSEIVSMSRQQWQCDLDRKVCFTVRPFGVALLDVTVPDKPLSKQGRLGVGIRYSASSFFEVDVINSPETPKEVLLSRNNQLFTITEKDSSGEATLTIRRWDLSNHPFISTRKDNDEPDPYRTLIYPPQPGTLSRDGRLLAAIAREEIIVYNQQLQPVARVPASVVLSGINQRYSELRQKNAIPTDKDKVGKGGRRSSLLPDKIDFFSASTRVVLSPDGRYLLVEVNWTPPRNTPPPKGPPADQERDGYSHLVIVWDVTANRESSRLPSQNGPRSPLLNGDDDMFNRDGSRMVRFLDGKLKILELPDLRVTREIPVPEDMPGLQPWFEWRDGLEVILLHAPEQAIEYRWDVNTGEPLGKKPLTPSIRQSRSQNGNVLLRKVTDDFAPKDGDARQRHSVEIRHVAGPNAGLTATLKVTPPTATGFTLESLSPDGSRVMVAELSASESATVRSLTRLRLFDTLTGRELLDLSADPFSKDYSRWSERMSGLEPGAGLWIDHGTRFCVVDGETGKQTFLDFRPLPESKP